MSYPRRLYALLIILALRWSKQKHTEVLKPDFQEHRFNSEQSFLFFSSSMGLFIPRFFSIYFALIVSLHYSEPWYAAEKRLRGAKMDNSSFIVREGISFFTSLFRANRAFSWLNQGLEVNNKY